MLLLAGQTAREPQPGAEHEGLPHGEAGKQLVVLHDVPRDALEVVPQGLVVGQDDTVQALGIDPGMKEKVPRVGSRYSIN